MPMDNEQALEALNKMTPILEQHLGVGIFVSDEVIPMPRISTGFTVLDYILGGGLPKGLITEIYGPEGTGKSSFATQVIKAQQDLDANFRALYLDFEQTFDQEYARDGLNLDIRKPRFILSQPDTIEEGCLLIKTLVPRGLVHMVVWDTPAASQPAAWVKTPLITAEGSNQNKIINAAMKNIEAGKTDVGQIGLHARVFTHEIAALIPHIKNSNTVFLVLNQLRTTINTWGAGETTPGGRGLKFNAAIRVRLSKTETTKDIVEDSLLGKGTNAVGQVVNFRTIKNKTAPQEKQVTVQLMYGRGFLDRETTFDLAVKRGIIAKGGGGNFELPGGKKIRGTENALKYWDENPIEYDKVRMAMLDTPLSEATDLAPTEELPPTVYDDAAEDESSDLPEGKVTL